MNGQAAHWVIQLYTSMHDQDRSVLIFGVKTLLRLQSLFSCRLQGQDLETFSCKHGLVAALLFHSEHVPLDFRRPSTEVEALWLCGFVSVKESKT